MKIAFTGKGGVGKTTLAAAFIGIVSQDGGEVLAVDCDPDSNLARTLGFPDADNIIPIAEMKELIYERMGIQGRERTFFKLNPKINDIPDRFSKVRGNIKLIVMGAVNRGGEGCMCPENTFIRNLLSHIVLKKSQHIIMDMEAGVEHLGRGTARFCDFVLIVVEPSFNSLETARKIRKFAQDIGIRGVYVIANKIRDREDIEFIKKELKEIPLIGSIDFDSSLREWEKGKVNPLPPDKLLRGMRKVKSFLEGGPN